MLNLMCRVYDAKHRAASTHWRPLGGGGVVYASVEPK